MPNLSGSYKVEMTVLLGSTRMVTWSPSKEAPPRIPVPAVLTWKWIWVVGSEGYGKGWGVQKGSRF
jgi:hypothetical protein